MPRPIYLIIFHSPIFPAHWALWVPQVEADVIGGTGKIINVQGSPNEGFVHELKRNYDLTTETRSYSMKYLCDISPSMVVDTDEGHRTGNVPIDDLEKAALAIQPPAPSLRSPSSVSLCRTKPCGNQC
jgi:hypothetical protein